MKYFFSILIIFIVSGLVACESSTPTPRPTLPNPQPTPVSEAATADEVKPLESQPSLDAPTIGYNEIKEGSLNEPTSADEWVFTPNQVNELTWP